jgi:wyosine [tRNA(Phe)-imidazoG37] synthetase (radical SAM superfamily)
MPETFDEAAYLQANPDVARAIAAGSIPNGEYHYDRFGRQEGRLLRPPGKSYTFYIDVFSYCNLRCPSCIVGNRYTEISAWPKGLMSPELLENIVDKARSECAINAIGLYNWTEPLLHPDIARLIRVVKSRNVPCWLSSNLNVLREPEQILAANPDFLRISLSGFTQDVYEIGHREGKIETVKENMRHLATARDVVQPTTKIEVFYHLYAYNKHELSEMADFANSLGFQFASTFAYITPVEKIIDIWQGKKTAEDIAMLNNLVVPLDEALAITSQLKNDHCTLLEDVVALDVEGNAMLCCSSSMAPVNRIGNFLALSLEELQQRRHSKALCGTCMDLGIPDYFAGHPDFEKIARRG